MSTTKLPGKTPTIRTEDQDLMRIQDNVTQTLDSALKVVKTFQDGTGTLKVASAKGNLTGSTGFRYIAIEDSLVSTSISSSRWPTDRPRQISMPYTGTIVAISAFTVNGAITAGTLVFGARVGGTVDTQTITISPSATQTSLILPTPVPFTAGQSIALQVTATGYTGTAGVYVAAALWVQT